ncbi:hypothetical protein QBC46DRAFT_388808 [Diplogelasinospora grovesii]|uniref:CHY-type domain-containing protein n=1 Tax=Diplogelasinospora grovesii TaxID=303347 RepID=A0AAN6S3X6_9PEZI|nr:hypothetical protein QBC46DRAFT_388808 [Diplogelasinospora grovesii]
MISIQKQGGVSSQQAVREAPASRIVPKPIPETQKQDARTYQIEQLRRRYSPKESTLENGETSLSLSIKPSDPDFPFDLEKLHCELRIPAAYPRHPPRLLVKNSDIPRGFSINIERGWDRLVAEKRGATLLALTSALDRRLESFLSEQKTETVKLMTFKDTRHLDQASSEPQPQQQRPQETPQPKQERRYIPDESFSREQIAEAKARRAQEVRQLEARMGRQPSYTKSSDGVVYTLPLEPKRRGDLPLGLQAVRSVQLIIPLLYPLQPLRILLNDVESEDAEGVEELFSRKATEQKQMTLMSHINYLTQNIHALAKQAKAQAQDSRIKVNSADSAKVVVDLEAAKIAEHTTAALDGDRVHIHVIPRPPEWGHDHDTDGSDYSDYDSDEEYTDEDGGGGVAVQPGQPGTTSSQNNHPEIGTAISFPSIELHHGIELLQISLLSISVKCERCKAMNEVTGLKDKVEKQGSCKKCATAFTVRFRQELVHQHSTRAGFIDAAGCTVADLLPSTFVPTCGKCSTPYSQGLLSVRGETTTNVCRECHSRFTFRIPEVKFLAYAPGMTRLPPTTGPRRKMEKLGLHAGEPLPDKGVCTHYKRSYRWFRFSCCSKVHPCDRCHDAAEDHVNEWANRMICGWCSREQNYSVESCAFCGRSVIGKRGKGYWEGGKGTRNKTLMRRGDKRKYRRVGGGEARKEKD